MIMVTCLKGQTSFRGEIYPGSCYELFKIIVASFSTIFVSFVRVACVLVT